METSMRPFRRREDNFPGGEFWKTFRADGHIIRVAGETRDDVSAIAVGNGGAGEAAGCFLNSDFCAGDSGASFYPYDGTADVAGVLSVETSGKQSAATRARQRNRKPREKMCERSRAYE